MELGPRELLTFVTVLSGLAATWGMVRQQIARVQEDIQSIKSELAEINSRLDKAESSTAVFQHQISVLGGILSPKDLREQHRELANLQARLEVAEKRIENNSKMHNGTHPPVG